MYVKVNPGVSPPTVTLEEPEDCKRFHVALAGGDIAGLGEALGTSGAGTMRSPDEAMIDVAWVRDQAAGRVPEGWEEDFAGMLGYARGKGWLDESGDKIQAHVESEGG
jgi:hypothetical protein